MIGWEHEMGQFIRKFLGACLLSVFLGFGLSAPHQLLAQDTPTNSNSGATGTNDDNTDSNEPDLEAVLPEWLYFAELKVSCSLQEPGTSYRGTQTAGVSGEKLLVEVSLQNCRYQVDNDGSGQLLAEVVLDLEDTANLEACNAFSLALLFEVTSKTDGFAWSGKKHLVDSLDVTSVYDDTRDIALFRLHDVTDQPVKMSTYLQNSGNYPGYVDLFWGEVVLLTSTGNEFQGLVERKLRAIEEKNRADTNSPKNAPPEYQLDLGVRMYPPRGSCADFPQAEDGKIAQHPISFE